MFQIVTTYCAGLWANLMGLPESPDVRFSTETGGIGKIIVISTTSHTTFFALAVLVAAHEESHLSQPDPNQN